MFRGIRSSWKRLVSGTLALALLAGCTTTHYEKSADREVYGVIGSRAGEVPGMEAEFSIDEEDASLEGLPRFAEEDVPEFLGEAGPAQVNSAILSLEQALKLAVTNSRDYQARKEALYLQALSFTLVRQQYTPVFSGAASGAYQAETIDVDKLPGSARLANAAPDFARAVGDLSGTPADLIQAYANVIEAAAAATGADATRTDIDQEARVTGQTSFGVDMLLRGGTRVAVTLTSNFLRFVTGDPRVTTSSALLADLSHPLLGSNRRTARETLFQAQRDLLYALRSYTRFRKSFSVDIASDYYRVLQQRDSVRNAWLGYKAFQQSLARSRALADAGRITKTDLGRQIEEELQSRNNWVTRIQQYEDALDRFKVKLGLDPDAPVVLDSAELDRMMERGPLPPPDFSLEDAVDVAFAARLDYYTQRDRTDDAWREVGLAADGLMPDIDLLASGRVTSPPGGDNFEDLDFKRYAWDAGLNVDLKLNRKPYRNDYRRVLIAYGQAKRDLEEFEDTTKLDVRQSWRALEQARVTYQIQRSSLAESERRVLHQELLLEVGEGNAIDQIDAQNALITARNRVSDALVNHTTAYLQVWLSMGILYIKEDGRWEDVTESDFLQAPQAEDNEAHSEK